ncbi:DUF3781 domain-containing protein [Extibacter muris]|uniref:DUF3781 domain-containing protein n=1 Tax=Extibacter muris TaxID=1796622 RepID=UPI001D0743B1|nr:DUF3781 domain-containing protein [Extibacter muris]MCB6200630.1 DUF3781 domain-containing protein [Extibacter muris]MCQ4663657.1 DUF3781 domain-containing protein [Extibacter muris]MCQ4692128.1 DUF3781 domain-containing protein [Extibacter muris]
MDRNHELLLHLDRLHTTELGVLRIKKNLSLDTNHVVDWCKEKMKQPGVSATRKGKNWYVHFDGCILTINADSYTIITAHKEK